MLLFNNNPILWNFRKVVGKWEADLSAAPELNVLVDGYNIFIVTCARECRKRVLFGVRSHGGLVKLFQRHFWQARAFIAPGQEKICSTYCFYLGCPISILLLRVTCAISWRQRYDLSRVFLAEFRSFTKIKCWAHHCSLVFLTWMFSRLIVKFVMVIDIFSFGIIFKSVFPILHFQT